MIRAVVLAFVLGVAVALPQAGLDKHWEAFKHKFGKQYHTIEERARRIIWEMNIMNIVHHNLEADLGTYSYRLGMNKYSDLTANEIQTTMNGYRLEAPPSNTGSNFILPSNVQIPDTVDWRKEGLVTGVKDQGNCGSCWAFSATGSLEGQHEKKAKSLVSLSEQNLMDCSWPEGNMGCNGGWMNQAFQYVIRNRGVDTEASYPYTAKDGNCRFNRSTVGATCTGFTNIRTFDENALKVAVATIGPISVAIDASQSDFHSYSTGVYDNRKCSSFMLDHGVLVVGYGTESGKDYWLVKNSWGESWGEAGYIKMSRNKNNQCGIATQASYPLV